MFGSECGGEDLCSDMPSLISIAKPTNYTFSLLFGIVSIDMLASCLDVSLNGLEKCIFQFLMAPFVHVK